ncbi:MAG: ABC transporter ATP-binding protein [Trueperaceae bacterium]
MKGSAPAAAGAGPAAATFPAATTVPPRVPALHVHDVSVRFGDALVLDDVRFDLEPGHFLAIVGPNGAGKSTLVKVALGLITPQRGHAAIFGHDAGDAPERIGYVPQLKTFDRTFPATAVELVVSGIRRQWPVRVAQAERARAMAALVDVGAEGLADRPLARLSGGELQRAFLARALVREPDLVLLDEPATGVDFLAEHDLYDLLERYQARRGATVAMVTHDLAAARFHASRVLVLNRRLHGYGLPEDVLCDECLHEAFGHVGHRHAVAF